MQGTGNLCGGSEHLLSQHYHLPLLSLFLHLLLEDLRVFGSFPLLRLLLVQFSLQICLLLRLRHLALVFLILEVSRPLGLAPGQVRPKILKFGRVERQLLPTGGCRTLSVGFFSDQFRLL